ncbi:integrase catalytic domain-containing protein [Trichonephila clavipes]|nr:integrase catalytic domain-containing protein [Trichonephila clavipes]
MIPVENNVKSMDSKIYFFPHHAVMKGDSVSTKLRVVFDGTCKPSNGNSILGIGKILQPDLFTILVKFRLNEIAFFADIQQMYRQILIDQEDQNFQRIVWRESKDSPIREYKLCTVTYGTASAPYLATRCLFQTGLDLERDDPAVSSLIKESFYIDDLMAGAPSSEEAISLIKTLSSILEARGFHLRKWRSNSSEVLSRIPSNWVRDSSNLKIHPDECSKALGLTWNSMKDIFIFNLKVNFPDNITKRSFLSQSARLFDPLGFLTPCTASIKIFYHQLWLLKLDWDSPLPEALATKWKTFQKEFEQVCSIHIPRWIHTASQQITLHGFCDASELAYASVIYAVQPQADGNTKLNGALLLARLYATCKNILKEYDVHFYAWTDSQVVLSCLSSHPRNWKPYIANRTSEILDLVSADSWRYVPTKMNPADIACRGLSPKELPTCVLWWESPQWLSCEMDSWPKQPKRNDQTSSVSKERKRTAFSFPVAVNGDFIDTLFLKFSSFTKIIDIFALCFRYITNCKARVGKMKNLDSKGKFHVPPLTTYERRQTSNKIFLYIQNLFFKEEISCIKANKPVVKKSILSALCPFIDKDGLIRVGGRFRNSTLQYGAKHPIILSNQHEICKLIVNMYHILYLHAGCTVLLGIIKQIYWIIGLKNIVKKCIYQCIVCCRYRATTSKQLMGDLPTHRVTPGRPFSVCGVYYAGPINILRYRGRGAKTTKGCIALFICFVTKALHLELVSDLTSETFIASLKRFCARRGAPNHIYCDNGTTFVGTRRKLQEIFKFASKLNENEHFCYFLSQVNIEWHFLALHTLLTQVEAILNSRPLVSLDYDNDSDSLNILTPSYFLIGEVITSSPEHTNDDKLSLHSRWDIVQKMKLSFWRKWKIDYPSNLQKRTKWKSPNNNFKVEEIVINKEDNIPPATWPLGKVIETHPGKDGVVRVVTLRTVKGQFKRPIHKLCKLPLHQE